MEYWNIGITVKKLQLVVFCLVGIISFSTSYAESPSLSLDVVLEKIEKAADPHNISGNVRTLITVIELSIPPQQIKMLVTTKDKFPDKSKKITEIPNVTSFTSIINNNEAWEVSAAGVRTITDRELEFCKFQLLMKTPSATMKDVFKDIKIEDGEFKIGELDCIKLVCISNTSSEFPPLNIYFSKKDFLVRRMEIILESKLGQIPVVTTIEEYKKINGRMIPIKTKTVQNGLTIESKLVSAKENIEIPDSEFSNPTPVEVYK